MTKIIALVAVAGVAAAANGQIIASQNFNGATEGTFVIDQFAVGTVDGQLTNAGASHDGSSGIGFNTFWTDTRGNLGPQATDLGSDTSDFIGVNAFGGTSAPDLAANGAAVAAGIEQNYQCGDSDGLIELVFDAVDTTGFSNRQLSFDYWINATGYEADDFFFASINGIVLFNWSEPDLEANSSADDFTANWGSVVFDLEGLGLGDSLVLTIGFDTNSGTENIFVDNIVFSNIPAPSAVALLGLGGIVARRRRA